MIETVVMIGAGRVATHLAQALRGRAGLRLVQVYSAGVGRGGGRRGVDDVG